MPLIVGAVMFFAWGVAPHLPGWTEWLIGPLLLLMYGLQKYRYLFSRRFPKTVLMDDQGETHSCVAVVYRRDKHGVELGADEGIAMMHDGWLTFEGQRTRFSLSYRLGAIIDFKQGGDERALICNGVWGNSYITLKDLTVRNRASQIPIAALLVKWQDSNLTEGDIACLPPLTSDPCMVSEQRSAFLVRSVACLVMAAAFRCGWNLSLSLRFPYSWIAGTLAGFAFWGAFEALLHMVRVPIRAVRRRGVDSEARRVLSSLQNATIESRPQSENDAKVRLGVG
ncbi:MAG TPA: hypothetical protein VG944_16285 [Fimbriimonas sp.]|nr:hypothetical protein [Fimbriimonas sp.]